MSRVCDIVRCSRSHAAVVGWNKPWQLMSRTHHLRPLTPHSLAAMLPAALLRQGAYDNWTILGWLSECCSSLSVSLPPGRLRQPHHLRVRPPDSLLPAAVAALSPFRVRTTTAPSSTRWTWRGACCASSRASCCAASPSRRWTSTTSARRSDVMIDGDDDNDADYCAAGS